MVSVLPPVHPRQRKMVISRRSRRSARGHHTSRTARRRHMLMIERLPPDLASSETGPHLQKRREPAVACSDSPVCHSMPIPLDKACLHPIDTPLHSPDQPSHCDFKQLYLITETSPSSGLKHVSSGDSRHRQVTSPPTLYSLSNPSCCTNLSGPALSLLFLLLGAQAEDLHLLQLALLYLDRAPDGTSRSARVL